MPVPILVIGSLAALALMGAALVIWPEIAKTVQNIIFPILKKYAPELAPLAKVAFVVLDKVASGIRLRAKSDARRAWIKIRKYVNTIYYDYFFLDGKYRQRTIIVTEGDGSGNKMYEKEQEINGDYLPDDVRESIMRDIDKVVRVDVHAILDDDLDIDADVNLT